MEGIILFSFILGVAYLLLISYLVYHWNRLPTEPLVPPLAPQTQVSILIPARNEATHILACLHAILQQNYPAELVEIMVLDDHSEDDTASLVRGLCSPNLRLIQLADYPLTGQAYKKQAIQLGIQLSRGELIVCTDADCVMGPLWLRSVVAFYEREQVQMITGPVVFHREKSLLERFQSLDFLGMMLLTGAGWQTGLIRMGNGANLAYTRQAFEAVGGFKGVDHLASGDDLFLMHKIEQRFPQQVKFLKSLDARVYTQAMPDWRSFIQQRLRWGTKNAAYQEWRITAVLALVFGLCWLIILYSVSLLFYGSFLLPWSLVVLSKLSADYLLLRCACIFFQRQDLLRVFWPAQVWHVLYIALIGLWANLNKNYHWKGRKVR